jgi:uncharacterized repeat protein (TIGR03943 family)
MAQMNHDQQTAQPKSANKEQSVRNIRVSFRWCASLFCLLWGGALFWLVSGKQLTAYLRPEFGYVLATAGLVFLFGIIAFIKTAKQPGLEYREVLKLIILILPLFYLVRSQGTVLGSYSLDRSSAGLPSLRGSVQSPGNSSNTNDPAGATQDRSFGQLPPGSPGMGGDTPEAIASREVADAGGAGKTGGNPVSLMQLYQNSETLIGRRVCILGMVSNNGEVCKLYGEKARLLFRFYFVCCAACAQPLTVMVKDGLQDMPDNEWVRISGDFTIQTDEQKRRIPFLSNIEYSKIHPPKEPYMY